MKRISLFAAVLCIALAACASGAERMSASHDARADGAVASLDAPCVGWTDVEPPRGVYQNWRTSQGSDGITVSLAGTELSLWQTTQTPRGSRSRLNWRFEYDGAIVSGRGRAGFVFGRASGAQLVAVEVTRAGSLRVIAWGKSVTGEPLGRIAWAKYGAISSPVRDVRISADYDIKTEILTVRLNGGDPIEVRLRSFMPSGPMTISDFGYFAAVPEADRRRKSLRDMCDDDIICSTMYTEVLHRSISAECE